MFLLFKYSMHFLTTGFLIFQIANCTSNGSGTDPQRELATCADVANIADCKAARPKNGDKCFPGIAGKCNKKPEKDNCTTIPKEDCDPKFAPKIPKHYKFTISCVQSAAGECEDGVAVKAKCQDITNMAECITSAEGACSTTMATPPTCTKEPKSCSDLPANATECNANSKTHYKSIPAGNGPCKLTGAGTTNAKCEEPAKSAAAECKDIADKTTPANCLATLTNGKKCASNKLGNDCVEVKGLTDCDKVNPAQCTQVGIPGCVKTDTAAECAVATDCTKIHVDDCASSSIAGGCVKNVGTNRCEAPLILPPNCVDYVGPLAARCKTALANTCWPARVGGACGPRAADCAALPETTQPECDNARTFYSYLTETCEFDAVNTKCKRNTGVPAHRVCRTVPTVDCNTTISAAGPCRVRIDDPRKCGNDFTKCSQIQLVEAVHCTDARAYYPNITRDCIHRQADPRNPTGNCENKPFDTCAQLAASDIALCTKERTTVNGFCSINPGNPLDCHKPMRCEDVVLPPIGPGGFTCADAKTRFNFATDCEPDAPNRCKTRVVGGPIVPGIVADCRTTSIDACNNSTLATGEHCKIQIDDDSQCEVVPTRCNQIKNGSGGTKGKCARAQAYYGLAQKCKLNPASVTFECMDDPRVVAPVANCSFYNTRTGNLSLCDGSPTNAGELCGLTTDTLFWAMRSLAKNWTLYRIT